MSKLVTIVITTYKRPDTLERAIESALNQSYDNIEIIVVDDNNEESEYRKLTENFMVKYEKNVKVKYIKHKKNMNGATARNTGIMNAKGDYITFLDDDDELLKDKIKFQVLKLNNMSNEYAAVYSGYEILRNDKIIKKNEPNEEGDLKKELLKMEWLFGSGSNPMFRKCVVDEVDGFDTSFRRYQDWEFMLRVFKKYKICCIKDILYNVYMDSRINVPNSDTLVELNKKYLKKFEEYILSFSEIDRNIIYKNHYLVIAKCFLANNNYSKFNYYYKIANKYVKISLKEKIKIVCNYLLNRSQIVTNLHGFVVSNKIKMNDYFKKYRMV